MNNINQLLFDFKFNKNYLDHDYYLSSSNKEAYNSINCCLQGKKIYFKFNSPN